MKKITLFIILGFSLNSYGQTAGNGVTDIDGNSYNTVIIGTQEWQKENLNVSKYADGTVIPQVTDDAEWAALTTGAWCYYNNDPVNGAIYGKLYNWYAMMGIYDAASLNDQSLRKQIAPTGWHVSTDTEWTTFTNYIGGEAVAGGKIKETGTSHWSNPNSDATNSYGFDGLPGGYRDIGFWAINMNADWWSSTISQNSDYWYRQVVYNNINCFRNSNSNQNGFSIRLINNTLLSNQSFNTNSFNIYPNPAKEQITIDFGNQTNIIGWSYKIVNTLGQEVLKGVINSPQSTIQLASLKSQGIYLVRIYDGSNNLMGSKKIIIQ